MWLLTVTLTLIFYYIFVALGGNTITIVAVLNEIFFFFLLTETESFELTHTVSTTNRANSSVLALPQHMVKFGNWSAGDHRYRRPLTTDIWFFSDFFLDTLKTMTSILTTCNIYFLTVFVHHYYSRGGGGGGDVEMLLGVRPSVSHKCLWTR